MMSGRHKTRAPATSTRNRLERWANPFSGDRDEACAAHLTSITFFVWALLLGIKCVIAYRNLSPWGGTPLIYDGHLLPSATRVVLCGAEDFMVCLFFLPIGLAINRLLPIHAGRRWLLILGYSTAAVAVGFALLNIPVFHVLRRFLNLPLAQFSGGFNLERSIYAHATPTLMAAFVLGPLCASAIYAATWPFLARMWLRVARIILRPVLLFPLFGLAFLGSHFARARWFPPDNNEFARNPHLLFVQSCFWTVSFSKTPPPLSSDMDDFRPAVDRASARSKRTFVPRNIILVVLESVSIPYLQVYGSSLPTTPALVGMAANTIILRNIYSNATFTKPSGVCLFSSRFNDPACNGLDRDLPSLAMSGAPCWLRKLGFKTYFLAGGDWEYSDTGKIFLSAGFDLSRDGYRPWSDGQRDWPFTRGEYDDRQLFADAAKCLADAGDQQFFLMLWTYDSHSPYRKVPCDTKFDDRQFPPSLRAAPDHRLQPNQAVYPERTEEFRRFLATIRQADSLISSLCSELRRLGLADSTLLVITGDHGDAFGEHGWFCHGHALFEEDVHVPMIFVSPRIKEVGIDANIVGSHVDLWPTLADLCEIPLNPHWQGKSLLDDQDSRRAYFFRPGALGVREGRFKYVWDYVVGKEYLFDLLSDPKENANISASHPELCVALRRRLRAWNEMGADIRRICL